MTLTPGAPGPAGVVLGLGTDLVDIGRFRRVLERTPTIVGRMFTGAERDYAEAARDPAARYAVRFAAKEAVLKALGVGLGAVRLADIEVLRSPGGAPELVVHGTAADRAGDRGVERFLVSLTHTRHLAQATVVALGSATAPGPDGSRP